jgi:cytoplasmic iron level regulating protein YaaA (DUF328/UPF0246 family)
VRILLPPSEAKTTGGRGRSLAARCTLAAPDQDAGTLAWCNARQPVLRALLQVCAGEDAREALLLPSSVAAAAIEGNRRVMSSPTRRALERYSGVLYEGMDAASFSPAESRLAGRSVLIFSGLFGVLAGAEPVPFYRVPAKAVLAGVGGVTGYWRRQLPDLLTRQLKDGIIVDLRSTDYRSMWRPRTDEAERLITVRVLSPKSDGTLSVVSYSSKRHKGRLVASLVRRAATAGGTVESADDVMAAWAAIGGLDARRSGPALDLVASD